MKMHIRFLFFFPRLPPPFSAARMDKCVKYPVQSKSTCLEQNDKSPCKYCKRIQSDRVFRREKRATKQWKTLLSGNHTQEQLHDDFARSCITEDADSLKGLFAVLAKAVAKIGFQKVRYIVITHAYNNACGNVSYGVSVIDHTGKETKLTFNNIFVGLRDIFDSPTYFYVTLSSVFGGCFQLVYLGSIPVLPGWQNDSPTRILQFNLAHLIRYQMIKTRNNSIAAKVCRDVKHINPAQYGHEFFFPAISHHSKGKQYYDSLFRMYAGNSTHLRSTSLDWTHRSLPFFIRRAARDDLNEAFPPSGIRPDKEHSTLLEYLSFSTSNFRFGKELDQSKCFETKAERLERISASSFWDDMPELASDDEESPMDTQANPKRPRYT